MNEYVYIYPDDEKRAIFAKAWVKNIIRKILLTLIPTYIIYVCLI